MLQHEGQISRTPCPDLAELFHPQSSTLEDYAKKTPALLGSCGICKIYILVITLATMMFLLKVQLHTHTT